MYTKEQLDNILYEISSYTIDIEPDPTLPHLGNPYLQALISKCRHYLNRVNYYINQVLIQEREKKRDLKIKELDLDLKMKQLLADDQIVRAQSNIKDREAVATATLRDEHLEVSGLRVEIQDLQEVVKILKSVHRELSGASRDIKTARQMIRDDKEFGGSSTVRGQDKSTPGGMLSPIRPNRIDPTDLLDDDKRPSYAPKPIDASHASQIASFLSDVEPDDSPSVTSSSTSEEEEDAPVIRAISYEELSE